MRRSADALKRPTYVEGQGFSELRGRTMRSEDWHVQGSAVLKSKAEHNFVRQN